MRSALVAVISFATATSARAEEPLYTCKEAPANSKLIASFKPDVALSDLVIWVAGFSCKNVIVAPDVAKHATKLTIVAPKQMTPKQAMQLFVDAVEASGLVVQQKSDSIVIKLGPNMPKNCPDVAAAGRSPKTYDAIPPTTPEDPDELSKAIDAGVKKISDTQYEINKALIDKVMANPMAFLKGARVMPALKDGKPEGMKLYAIRPSSPYAKLGLTNADTLLTINGIQMTSAENALEVYTKVKGAKKLDIVLLRRGKPMTITYVIK